MSEELFRKAMHKTATNKQRAMTRVLEKKAQLVQKMPELEDIKRQKDLHCIKMARLRIVGGCEDEIEQILNEINTLEQKESKILQQNGVNDSDFQPDFTCKICSDTGQTNGKTCECVLRIVAQLRKEEIEKTSVLKLCDFDTFDVSKYPNTSYDGVNMREHMADIYEYCKAYADMFTMKNTSIYMCGNAGLGKTHLALSIANTVLNKGYNVVYVSAQQAFEKVENEHFKDNGNTLRTMENADLLILDDLGTEYISPYVSACLYSLINARCMKKPTIYTSNIVNDGDLRRRYTEKIVSRLLGSCDVLTFCGEDIRLSDI